MGVTGLWKLIEPSGKPVPLDTLENKILAIDISIWLHQVVKGFQDSKGNALAHAHLLGLFHRLCKLLYYRIKPVFVFDGGVPQLKRETIQKRSQNRNKYLNEADRLQNLLLKSLAKEKVVQQALGPNACEILSSPIKIKSNEKPEKDDMFKLPTLPEEEFNESSTCSEITSESDGSFDDTNLRHNYHMNIQSIDINSAHFKNLPADVRHEILTDLKETRKQSSWGKLHELPVKRDDFSSFQMNKLLKRRQIQVSLEDAEKQMEGKSLTLNELRNLLTEEGVVSVQKKESTKHIASDENTRFLLVRDLKNAIEKAEKLEMDRKDEADKVIVPASDQDLSTDSMDKQYDLELQKAIQLSLKSGVQELNDEEENQDTNQQIKLNGQQRKQLNAAASSLARAYMIEYGGMTDEGIERMFEESQNQLSASFNFQHNSQFILKGETLPHKHSKDAPSTTKLAATEITEPNENKSIVSHILSDSDDEIEFVDVPEITATTSKSITESKDHKLEIFLNLSDHLEDEDLFADIFKAKNSTLESTSHCKLPDKELLNTNLPKKDIASKDDLIKTENPNFEKFKENFKESKYDSKDSSETQGSSEKYEANNKKILPKENILAKLKEDMNNISKITLEEIEIGPEQINKNIEFEGLDVDLDKKMKNEIIEISEEDENIQRTPSKKKINDFFETEFTVKRTPEKLIQEEDSTTPKVKSPFFVRKTPESRGKKRGDSKTIFEENDNDETPSRSNKVSRTLFNNVAEQTDNISTEKLQNLATEIAQEKRTIELERNKQDRMGMSITDRMSSECMQLLKLFGVPYVVAPMEAEAQCAFFDAIQLTDGTITDDSDIWLFGGRTVYKNFFNQNKHVMEFKCSNIEKLFHVNRHKLIQLAILVGSDYTTGVNGIGTVTALEILATFPTTPMLNDEVTETVSSLHKFREWWSTGKKIGTGGKTALRSKLKNIELTESFPNYNVVEAYMYPKVDDNSEKFTWGHPDVETIREFTKKKFGWTRIKTDEILNPVMKRLNEKKLQQSITNYFDVKTPVSVKELKVSKRVKKAINKMSGENTCDIDEPKSKVSRDSQPRREKSLKDKLSKQLKKPKLKKLEPSNSDACDQIASTSSITAPQSSQKTPVIPQTNIKIPQKEKDLVELERNKEKAIQLFKKLQSNKKAVKKL